MSYRRTVLSTYSRLLAVFCGLLIVAAKPSWSAETPTPEIKQASVNGVTLVYQEQGVGAPVVFVHGCCTDYRAWEAQRSPVAQGYKFIGLNLRYHGTATWPDDGSKYAHQQHADDIAAFIRGLNAGPVDLVGWSYSGPIVMLVAVQHPELLHSLAIHEPAGLSFVTDQERVKRAGEDRQAMLGPALTAVKAGDVAGAARQVPVGVNSQPDFWDSATSDVRSMFADNARTIPLAFITAPPPPPVTCDQLGQLKMPVLMTFGGDTRIFYRIATEAAANCIPGALLVSIQGGRHLAMAQQPELFNAVLLQFLAKAGSNQP